jgi:hypothetical protein
VLDQFPRDGLRHRPPDVRVMTWATTMRAVKTTDALLMLADAGYGEQEMMLTRSVLEDTVVAWWCTTRPAEELDRLMRSHEMSAPWHVQPDWPGREDIKLLHPVPVLPQRALEMLRRPLDSGPVRPIARS